MYENYEAYDFYDCQPFGDAMRWEEEQLSQEREDFEYGEFDCVCDEPDCLVCIEQRENFDCCWED